MSTRCFIRPFECGGEITAALYMYSQIYAAQIILVTLLSAVTIFRREMSCNHEYSAPKEDEDNEREMMENSGKEWEEVLEGAGKWGSGKPLTEMIQTIWGSLSQIRRGAAKLEDLLEGSGLPLTGEPFWSTVLGVWIRSWLSLLRNEHEKDLKQREKDRKNVTPSPFCTDLLPDAQVHILSFLNPKDVTSFACCSSSCSDLVDNPANDTCLQLWKSLWDRDYAWLIQEWKVGIEAKRRSVFERPIDKQLYMEFGQTFINYLLVGHNTMEDCLVGLHGNIYDLTGFLEEHPGSPETLLVHAGQDATRTFDTIGHSFTARKLGANMCVVVDRSCQGGCGTVRPAAATRKTRGIPLKRRLRRPSTLRKVRNRLQSEEKAAQRNFARLLPSDCVGVATVYYDAFDREWKAWYTDDSFETQYLLHRR